MFSQAYVRTELSSSRERRFAVRLSERVAKLVATLLAWHDRARSRRLLATLDDRMLSDIGVSRAGAGRESATVFWR